MDAWYQCENPYPFVPQEILDSVDSVRASLPNSYCDPKVAADLFEEVLDEEGLRVGSKLLRFLNTSLKSAPQHSKFLPGATPPALAPELYRGAPRPGASTTGPRVASASRNAAALIGMTTEEAMKRGILFVGNPDTVYHRIMDFYAEVGGFSHLVLVGRTGHMTHTETEKSIKLFSNEVLPRLREIAPITPA